MGEPAHANLLEVIDSTVNDTFNFEGGGKSLGIGLAPSMTDGLPMSGPRSLLDPNLREALRFSERKLVDSDDIFTEYIVHIKK